MKVVTPCNVRVKSVNIDDRNRKKSILKKSQSCKTLYATHITNMDLIFRNIELSEITREKRIIND